MAANSSIEWTDHTFNPWRGCTKVSAGCDHCYADTLSKRNPSVLGVWGQDGSRPIAAPSYWRQPARWNKEAAESGDRHRVFCASLADVFEGPDTMPADAVDAVRKARVALFDIIRQTPHLDWLLLTKRPENVLNVIDETHILAEGGDPDDEEWFANNGDSFPETDLARWLNDWREIPPANVWLGTSVENQAAADKRIPHLLSCPAAVRFLSCEPLLGAVDLMPWFDPSGACCQQEGGACKDCPFEADWRHGPTTEYDDEGRGYTSPELHWVIAGGESGHKARPMHPDWVRSIRDQCAEAGVPFHFKQWGQWLPCGMVEDETKFPTQLLDGTIMCRVGKKAAGRTLDGVTRDAFPEVPDA